MGVRKKGEDSRAKQCHLHVHVHAATSYQRCCLGLKHGRVYRQALCAVSDPSVAIPRLKADSKGRVTMCSHQFVSAAKGYRRFVAGTVIDRQRVDPHRTTLALLRRPDSFEQRGDRSHRLVLGPILVTNRLFSCVKRPDVIIGRWRAALSIESAVVRYKRRRHS